MKRCLFLVVLACALAAGSAGAAPVRINKVEMPWAVLVQDTSCPQATHKLVLRCQLSGDIPQFYVRLRPNDDVSSLVNEQVRVKGVLAKEPNSCSLPILESPKMELLFPLVFDCFD